MAQGREGSGATWLWCGAAAASALAVLTKGLIGMVAPGAVAFFYIVMTGRWRMLRSVPWIRAGLLFLAVAVPWHAVMARRYGDFIDFYLIREHLMRFATPIAHRPGQAWYYAPVIIAGMLPWVFVVMTSVGLFGREAGSSLRRDRAHLLFLLAWAGFILVFFSASQSKLIPYVLPALPPLAVLAGLTLARAERAGVGARAAKVGLAIGAVAVLLLAGVLVAAAMGGLRGVLVAAGPNVFLFALSAGTMVLALMALLLSRGPVPRTAALLALAGAGLFLGLWTVSPRIRVKENQYPMAALLTARMQPGDKLFMYAFCPYTLAVALERELDAVEYQGEMEFGVAHLSAEERSRRFPDLETFKGLWESDQTVWLVLHRRWEPVIAKAGVHLGTPVALFGDLRVVTNHPSEMAPGGR
jgi:4-amino-4-deoxy-L-arabinose transferase-like glycosyltransferase